MEPQGSFPCSQLPATGAYPEQEHPAHNFPLYFPKIRSNIIFPSTPRSFQWCLPFGTLNQNPVNTSPFPMCATYPAHVILLNLITQKYSVKNTGCEVHHYAVFSTIRLVPF